MPGISLKCDFSKKIRRTGNDANKSFFDASKSIIHNNYYKEEILLNEYPYLIVCTRYPEYPIEILNNSDYWICIEGKIYNKQISVLHDELYKLIKHIFDSRNKNQSDKKIIADWLADTDGDFVIYGLNKNTMDFVILNDFLGRLPFYYTKSSYEMIGSREIQMISYIQDNTSNIPKFDQMGVAQFLLFSHTVGKRTLLNEVSRLEPASILMICSNSSQVELQNIYSFNFGDREHANKDIKKNAHELARLFKQACETRVNQNSKNILSLSGGFDSRAVGAVINDNETGLYAVTSPEPNWKPVVGGVSETEVAKKLSEIWNIQCDTYDIMTPKANNMIALLKMKSGLIYLAHSFLPRFLEEIKMKNPSSPINFFTGHGGDVSFANLSFDIPNLDSCVGGIIRVKGRLPLRIVTSLTGIQVSELWKEIRSVLESYPEESASAKLVHFLFFENNAKFSFEIEDVNRFYFWSVAPFYSVHFFRYIFNCSDKDKEKLVLYREFLNLLSPAVASVVNSNWGCSILSKKFKLLQYILYLSFKYPKIRKYIKRVYDKRAYNYNENSKIISCIRDQIKNCKAISKFLSIDLTQSILNECSQYSHEGIDNLLTITSMIEKSQCKTSSIYKYF
jgi:asparagine synthase (glutamine-hydrolysing)